MHFTYRHESTRPAVRQRIDGAIERALASQPAMVQDVRREWRGDVLTFSLRAMGQGVRGTVEVTDTDVIMDVGLPLMLRPFESRAKSRMLAALNKALR
jgi:hypothetical protein